WYGCRIDDCTLPHGHLPHALWFLQDRIDSLMLSSSEAAGAPFEKKGARHMQNNKTGVAVIGAGLAGLSAAMALNEAEVAVTLFEGTGACGGRLGDDPAVDLGAQYFAARHPAFRQACREWETRGWIAEWSPQLYRHDLEQ